MTVPPNTDRARQCSVSAYAEEGATERSEARWVALARSCANDQGFSVGDATGSGTTILSHFAILLIGPISLGTLIISIDGGDNISRFDSASGQAAVAREVVNVPPKLLLPPESVVDKPVEPKPHMPDLVPRQRGRPDPRPSVNDDADRTAERVVIEEVVISVKRIKEPENAIRPNAPTLLGVQ